ncbi:MAG: hypothetical protein PVF49_02365 [Anaerolineales bacterium]|jgi:Ca2+-binding RTX toxin-like protein
MKPSRLLLSGLGLLVLIVLLSAIGAFAASNTVPFTRLDDESGAITANDLAPSECSGINLVNVILISGNGNGTNDNDLILGSPGDDSIRGQGGDDCIIGGGGDDFLHGGNGTDVCNGGTGTDSANRCETELNIP